MKKQLSSKLISFLPLTVGIVILVISAMFVPWNKVIPYLKGIGLLTIAELLLLSILYYFGRSLRYWLMLRMLGHQVSIWPVTMATMVAQPVSILPGGELYRSTMLKRYCNVDLKDGIPTVFAQSVAETVGLLIIAAIGAIFLRQYAVFVLVFGAIFVALLVYIRRHNARKSRKIINKLPKVNLSLPRVKGFLQKNRILLTGSNFIQLVLISYIMTGAGIAIVWLTIVALDKPFNLFESSVAYTIPLMLQSLSFLPGGIGVNEQGSVGILVLFGLSVPAAVAATIIIRIFTMGTGFLYGFGAMALDKALSLKRYS